MSESKEYKFKSAGVDPKIVSDEINVVNEINLMPPIGIRTPIQFDNMGESSFIMNHQLRDQAKDNLRNLLLTNYGERLGNAGFGANLRELAFELGTDAGMSLAQERIQKAVSRWMPYIKLESVQEFSTSEGETLKTSGIDLVYSVPSIGVTNEGISIIIFTVN